jgi:hypothetical protein
MTTAFSSESAESCSEALLGVSWRTPVSSLARVVSWDRQRRECGDVRSRVLIVRIGKLDR